MKACKRLICLVLMALIAILPISSCFAKEKYEDAINSVVRIYTEVSISQLWNGSVASTYQGYTTGSGFAIGEKGKAVNTFVTNKHVVEQDLDEWRELVVKLAGDEAYTIANGTTGNITDSETGQIAKVKITYSIQTAVYVVLDDLNTKKEATRIITSDSYDLACVILPNAVDSRSAAQILINDDIGKEKVWAIGFPGNSDDWITIDMKDSLPSTINYCTVTEGMAQYVMENTTYGKCIQHTASITNGNSGGPLVNAKGQVIGVNTWGSTSSDASKINVAQASSQLKQFLDSQSITAWYASPVNYTWINIAVVVAIVGLIALLVVLFLRKKPRETRELVAGTTCALGNGKAYSLKPGKTYVIGTQADRCTIPFPERTPGVSHVHCTIRFDGTSVKIKDENSKYGTYINGEKLPAGAQQVMHRGQILGIGSKKEYFTLR